MNLSFLDQMEKFTITTEDRSAVDKFLYNFPFQINDNDCDAELVERFGEHCYVEINETWYPLSFRNAVLHQITIGRSYRWAILKDNNSTRYCFKTEEDAILARMMS